jgi:ZIP family zinc transporter
MTNANILQLALLGGLLSFVTTSFGAAITPFFSRTEKLQKMRLSIDFALGTMLSATAFSLVGPQVTQALGDQHLLLLVLGGFSGGVIFIGLTNRLIEGWSVRSGQSVAEPARLVLALALIFHNLPEGMGAGASLAGMELAAAIPVQAAIAIQNVAEGIILALCLRGFGWSWVAAVLGGVGSGLVEFSGAAVAGVALGFTLKTLPFFLSVAGGAMLMSVLIELKESLVQGRALRGRELLAGFLMIPLMNLLLSAGS